MRAIRHLRTTTGLAGLAGLLAVLPAPALAAPGYLGPSGYILTPDAMVAPDRCLNGGFHFFENDRGRDFSAAAANYGIGDRFEVGATFFNVHGPGSSTDFWLNGKASLLKPDQPFQIAGGVIDLLDETDRGAYVVGSVNVGEQFESELLPRSLRVGAGWGSGNFIDGLFVNGGFALGSIQLLAEWIDRPNLVNLGGRYQLGGWTFDLAGVNLSHDASVAVGASYTYCFGRGGGDDTDEEPNKGEPEQKARATGRRPAPVPAAAASTRPAR
jgi:hypothetical protein